VREDGKFGTRIFNCVRGCGLTAAPTSVWIRALGSSLQRDSPRSHDAAGGMESLAGGACALGEVGWTF